MFELCMIVHSQITVLYEQGKSGFSNDYKKTQKTLIFNGSGQWKSNWSNGDLDLSLTMPKFNIGFSHSSSATLTPNLNFVKLRCGQWGSILVMVTLTFEGGCPTSIGLFLLYSATHTSRLTLMWHSFSTYDQNKDILYLIMVTLTFDWLCPNQ